MTSNLGPLDGFMERQLRDGSPDKVAASGGFHRESGLLASLVMSEQVMRKTAGAQGFSDQIRTLGGSLQQGERDKLTYASVAFCSPLALIGMGAALAIFDEFKMLKEGAALATQDEAAQRLRPRFARVEADDKNKMAVRERSRLSQIDFRPESLRIQERALSLELRSPKKSVSERFDCKADFMRMAGSREWSTGRWFQCGANFMKVGKLIKSKQLLSDHLEKMRGKLDLSKASALISKIELLDKALKRLGN